MNKLAKSSTFRKLKSWHPVPSLHGKWMGNNGNSDRLYFLGLQNHCLWWLQPWNEKMLAPWKKVMTNLYRILKSRDVILLTKARLVKAMVVPVVMYRCESWAIKKAEHHRIDAFELWCCRRLLRIPWTAKRSNQSILKEINHEYSWKAWCWSWNSNTLVTCCEELTH